ncbi:MAG: protein-disulfide reductase DsbD family protein, partial [Armatimonadota bacterium]|nr:protein-disulfide reductase DsbD family protein [Armatimonadota bacterium]
MGWGDAVERVYHRTHRRATGFLLALAAAVVGVAAAPGAAQGLAGPQLKVSVVTSLEPIRPGDRFRIAVILDLPAGLHVNAHVPSEEYLIPTEVKLTAPEGLTLGAVEYPEAHAAKFAFTEKPIQVYTGRVVFFASASAAAALKPGALVLRGELGTQPCDDRVCYPPQTVPFSTTLKVAAPGTPVTEAHADVFEFQRWPAGPLPATGAGAPDGPPSGEGVAGAAGSPVLNGFLPPAQFIAWLREAEAGGGSDAPDRLGDLLRGGNWLLALPLIYLVGLALNLTPCVYPLIPITVGYFGGQAGG